MANFIKAFKFSPVTVSLVLLMVVIYGVEVLLARGLTITIPVLFHLGADYTPAVLVLHQWWRLISAGFLHISLSHIALNLLALYFIGRLLERALGSWRFSGIFLLAVIGGNLTTLALGQLQAISAGASGGIFGLFGAVIAVGYLYPTQPFWRAQAKSMGLFVILSLATTIFTPNIDLTAHLGGFVSGILTAAVLTPNTTRPQLVTQWSLYRWVSAGLLVLGWFLLLLRALGRL